MNINLILIVLSVAFVTVRCGDSNETTPRRFHSQISIDGIIRSYTLNLPPERQKDDNIPLVVMLHGFGGEGSQAERDYGWTAKGDDNNFAVVYPDGVRNTGKLGLRTWNAGTCCQYAMEQNIDDVRFITAMVNEITANYPIDTKRIYVTGMSNGGMMVYRLACEQADLFAAFASVSGPFVAKSTCNASRPVPLLHIHSDIDEKIPFEGGVGLGGYYYPPVDSGLQVFVERNSCQGYEEQHVPGRYLYRHWNKCLDNTDIESYLVYDGGHSWPGGLKPTPRSDSPSTALVATDIIWDFFAGHQLP